MESVGSVRRESNWQLTVRQTPKVLATCILLAIAIIGALSLLKATCFGSLSIGPLEYIPFEASIAVTAVGVLGVLVLFVYFCRNQNVSEKGSRLERRKPQASHKSSHHATTANTSGKSSQTVVGGQVPPGDSSVALPKSPTAPSSQPPPQLTVPASPSSASSVNLFASPMSGSTPSLQAPPTVDDAQLRARFLEIEATAYSRRETYHEAIVEILKQKRNVYHISQDDSTPPKTAYLTSNKQGKLGYLVYDSNGLHADPKATSLKALLEGFKQRKWVSLKQSLGLE